MLSDKKGALQPDHRSGSSDGDYDLTAWFAIDGKIESISGILQGKDIFDERLEFAGCTELLKFLPVLR